MSQTFIPTLDMLAALKAAIAAIETSPGIPLFETVEYFAETDLVKALDQLRLARSSICLLIPDSDRYETTKAGRENRTEVLRQIVLLLADRHFGRPQSGSTGDATHLGVVAKKDILEDALCGINLSFKPRLVRPHPVTGTSFQIALDQSAGRKAWQMTWELSGGWKVTQEF